jgi:hypothetical protein
MKYIYILTILCFSFNSKAQDLIIYKDGSEVYAKINKITDEKIFFKKTSNLDGPSYSKYISEVFMVRYQNGTKDIFNVNKNSKNQNGSLINQQDVKSCTHLSSQIVLSNSRYMWQCVDCNYNIRYAKEGEVKQYLSNNNSLNNTELKPPCGPKPLEPPSFNNSQFKSTKRYKDFLKKLKEWEECQK